MPHDRPSSENSSRVDEGHDETERIEWEAKWTRKDRTDHLLIVPSASNRNSIEEFIVLDPSCLKDLSEWR